MELYYRKFKVYGPASHIRGKDPIDGVWSSGGVVPTIVTVFSHSFGVGDHRAMIVDFEKKDLQGSTAAICRPSMRRLICDYPAIVEKYNEEAYHLLQYNNVPKQLDRLERQWCQLDAPSRATKLNRIDQQVTELLLHAEKECRKLRMGEVDFSPEVSNAADKWYL